jgi:predicted component of type VI protein secretion system
VSTAVFVEEQPVGGRRVDAVPGVVIGREGCDVVLADPEVSRRHAAIRSVAGGVAIEDLGSTNGTFVNERRVSGVEPLRDGDTVRFGNTVWRLHAPAAAPATVIGDAAPTVLPSSAGVGPRGDVPAPPDEPPSAIRTVLPAPAAAAPVPSFNPPPQRLISARRGSAATRDWATVACLVFALAVAIALVVYFASQS